MLPSLMVTMLLVGCKDTQTPQRDTTELWPAYSISAEKWGFIDAKGKFAIQPIFDDVNGFSCGYAIVEMGGELRYVDKQGNLQSPMSMDDADDFYYNYAVFEMDDNYGLLDNKMNVAIYPMYEYLQHIGDNGLIAAKLSSSDMYGYINTKGEQKIQPMYNWADAFLDGGAVVRMGNKYGVINSKGDFTIAPIYDWGLLNMGEGLIGYMGNNGKVGAMDLKGNIVIQPMYSGYQPLVDNSLIAVAINDKWGYINMKGDVKIQMQYYDASSFFGGYAWVRLNENSRYTLIDTKGNVCLTLSTNEEPVTGMHNGLALIETTNGYKYIDVNGKVVYTWLDDDWKSPKRMSAERENSNMVEQTLHFSSKVLR